MRKNSPIILDDNALKKWGLSIDEFVTLMVLTHRVNIEENFDSLSKKGLIGKNNLAEAKEDIYYPTIRGKNVIMSIVTDVSADGISDEYLEDLAKSLQDVFPPGKKAGTTYYFKGSTKEIMNKLKEFIKRFGNSYTKETMVAAAKKYVEDNDFGNNTYMQLLKYFIVKNKPNGEIMSELASYAENLKDDVEIPNYTERLI